MINNTGTKLLEPYMMDCYVRKWFPRLLEDPKVFHMTSSDLITFHKKCKKGVRLEAETFYQVIIFEASGGRRHGLETFPSLVDDFLDDGNARWQQDWRPRKGPTVG